MQDSLDLPLGASMHPAPPLYQTLCSIVTEVCDSMRAMQKASCCGQAAAVVRALLQLTTAANTESQLLCCCTSGHHHVTQALVLIALPLLLINLHASQKITGAGQQHTAAVSHQSEIPA